MQSKFPLAIMVLSFIFCVQNKLPAQNSKNPELSKEVILEKSDSLYFAGRPDLMIKLLEPSADRYPENFGINYGLFISNTSIGRFEEGEKWLRRSLELDETLPEIMLGFLYFLKSDEEKIRQELEKSIKSASSGNTELWKDIGILEAALGEFSFAKEHFEKYRQAFPDEEMPVPHYANALLHTGEKEKAKILLKEHKMKMLKELEENPNYDYPHYVLAEIAALEGDALKCVKHLRISVDKKLPYSFYYGLSNENGDPLWNKVRAHPSFQELLHEKKEQIDRMLKNLEASS